MIELAKKILTDKGITGTVELVDASPEPTALMLTLDGKRSPGERKGLARAITDAMKAEGMKPVCVMVKSEGGLDVCHPDMP